MQKMQETWVWSLGWEDPLEKETATYSSILAWKIPWTEEPGGLQSMGSQRAGHEQLSTLTQSCLRDWPCWGCWLSVPGSGSHSDSTAEQLDDLQLTRGSPMSQWQRGEPTEPWSVSLPSWGTWPRARSWMRTMWKSRQTQQITHKPYSSELHFPFVPP